MVYGLNFQKYRKMVHLGIHTVVPQFQRTTENICIAHKEMKDVTTKKVKSKVRLYYSAL